MTTPMLCATCHYWDLLSPDEQIVAECKMGTCHRYPPTVLSPEDGVDVFPTTYDSDWCGEYKERLPPGTTKLNWPGDG